MYVLSFQNFKRRVIKIFGNMKTLVPKQDSQNPPGSPICMERTTLVFIIITVLIRWVCAQLYKLQKRVHSIRSRK
jgi:hypothetical protein